MSESRGKHGVRRGVYIDDRRDRMATILMHRMDENQNRREPDGEPLARSSVIGLAIEKLFREQFPEVFEDAIKAAETAALSAVPLSPDEDPADWGMNGSRLRIYVATLTAVEDASIYALAAALDPGIAAIPLDQ